MTILMTLMKENNTKEMFHHLIKNSIAESDCNIADEFESEETNLMELRMQKPIKGLSSYFEEFESVNDSDGVIQFPYYNKRVITITQKSQ